MTGEMAPSEKPRRRRGTILALVGLLVVSNGLWAYALVDAAVSHTYLQDSYSSCDAALSQALELLPDAAAPRATRETIISAAARRAPDDEPFEKEGFVWVGDLGLSFDGEGRLVRAVSVYSAP